MVVKRIEIGIAGREIRTSSFDWVEQLARDLLLRGAVFSRPDGSVKVVAEGEETALRTFVEKLERGNIFGTVENFFVRWHEPSKKMGNFYVLVGA